MKRVKLGEVCTVVSGSTPKTNIAEYWDGDKDWITPAELSDESYIINESIRKITQLGAEKTGLKPFPKGTVLLSSRAPIGKVAIAGKEMYCNQGFKNLICSENINNEYLFWFLKCNTILLNSLGRGATFKEISKDIVENVEIPLPDLKEQEYIANVLKRCWNIIAQQKLLINDCNRLIKARFVEMFGDDTTSATKRILKDIADVSVGIANSATHSYVDTGVVLLRNQNIKENYLDDSDLIYIKSEFATLYQNKKLKENDILVTRTGYPGVACLVPGKYAGCQTFTTLIVRLKHIPDFLPVYICHYINSQYGKAFVEEMKVGVAQQNFGAKSLEKMPIVIPPIDKQLQFAAFVEQTDKLKVTIQKSINEMQLLYDSLLQKNFG